MHLHPCMQNHQGAGGQNLPWELTWAALIIFQSSPLTYPLVRLQPPKTCLNFCEAPYCVAKLETRYIHCEVREIYQDASIGYECGHAASSSNACCGSCDTCAFQKVLDIHQRCSGPILRLVFEPLAGLPSMQRTHRRRNFRLTQKTRYDRYSPGQNGTQLTPGN